MNKRYLRTALISLLLAFPSVGVSDIDSFGYPNRYSNMAETLFDMMDAFSNAYQRHRDQPVDYPPFTSPIPGYGYNPYPPEYALTGSWRGQGGEALIIRNGQFRVFRNRNWFRDGRITIQDQHHFTLQELQTGAVRHYEFAESRGRLALRDPFGNILLFRRISR